MEEEIDIDELNYSRLKDSIRILNSLELISDDEYDSLMDKLRKKYNKNGIK